MQCLRLRFRGILPRLVPIRYYAKKTDIPEDVMEEMEEGFINLCNSDSPSLLRKYLTRDLFDELKVKTTPTYKSNLLDCVRSGMYNFNSNVGIYAADPESYKTFAKLFDPIIEEYHGFKQGDKHPASCFGYGSDFPDLDPERKFILSTRIRCARSLDGFPFNPMLTHCDYAQLQTTICRAFDRLCGEFSGKYFAVCNMKEKVKEKLIADHYMFREDDPFLEQGMAFRYWPLGRGIFMNRQKTFIVWVNEEDHVRIISMEKGGDLGRVYERMIIGVESLAHEMKFAHDPHLGHINFCPTNLGTSIRASVHIKLPSISSEATVVDVAEKYSLQVRGTRGENSSPDNGIYDISNKRRMGVTEYQIITEMYNGIKAIIETECQAAMDMERIMKATAKDNMVLKGEEMQKIKRVDKCSPKKKPGDKKTDDKKAGAKKPEAKKANDKKTVAKKAAANATAAKKVAAKKPQAKKGGDKKDKKGGAGKKK
ncbi:arginine kinase 1-like [Drosophila nasuta]|uniref:arginine kinase 1-like n=1 Tax=Drosophila nasuta TaxID=42062 RepID=UPI00295F2ABA|nr:arginine kinase 1-like [Drosophila nasuta]